MFAILQNRLRDRIAAWDRKRQGDTGSSVMLHRRRVYILPTWQGMLYALIVFAMLLGSMNYSNSLGFVMTFFLASLGMVAMHQTHRNLENLVVRRGRNTPVHVGQEAIFNLHVENDSPKARRGITLSWQGAPQSRIDIDDNGAGKLYFGVPAQRRGWLVPGRIALHTSWPFGLFRAWSWIYLEQALVVYPKPSTTNPTPPMQAADQGESRYTEGGQGDFSGLRNYRPGDSPRHIAWKASARLESELFIKEFEGGTAAIREFDYDTVPAGNTEQRLEILTRWLLDADAAGDRYGLKLPGVHYPPATGQVHLQRCLRALALYQLPDSPPSVMEVELP